MEESTYMIQCIEKRVNDIKRGVDLGNEYYEGLDNVMNKVWGYYYDIELMDINKKYKKE